MIGTLVINSRQKAIIMISNQIREDYYLQDTENEVKFKKFKLMALLLSFIVLLMLSGNIPF